MSDFNTTEHKFCITRYVVEVQCINTVNVLTYFRAFWSYSFHLTAPTFCTVAINAAYCKSLIDTSD